MTCAIDQPLARQPHEGLAGLRPLQRRGVRSSEGDRFRGIYLCAAVAAVRLFIKPWCNRSPYSRLASRPWA